VIAGLVDGSCVRTKIVNPLSLEARSSEGSNSQYKRLVRAVGLLQVKQVTRKARTLGAGGRNYGAMACRSHARNENSGSAKIQRYRFHFLLLTRVSQTDPFGSRRRSLRCRPTLVHAPVLARHGSEV